MSFQNIIFKHVNCQSDSKLDAYATEKLSGLEKYSAGQPFSVELEYERITSHQSGDLCRVEVNVMVEGKLHRAVTEQSTFEAAIDVVRDQLDNELDKAKGKRASLFRRGARKIKEMMRLGK
jgi:ribosomal subunit interface protein